MGIAFGYSGSEYDPDTVDDTDATKGGGDLDVTAPGTAGPAELTRV